MFVIVENLHSFISPPDIKIYTVKITVEYTKIIFSIKIDYFVPCNTSL